MKLARRELTRRGLITGAAGLAAAGCKQAPRKRSAVSIVRAPAYGEGLYDTLRRIIATHELDVRQKRVVLKPNLVEFDPGTTINTHPLFVHAAAEAFRAAGASEVRIAEGPGHRRVTLDLADAAGYFQRFNAFESSFTDLNLDELTRVPLASPHSKLRQLYLPNTALSCDLLVSLPKLKTHHWVGATLSMKNLFGVVPGGVYGWPKNVLHWAGIDQTIADLYNLFPRTFAIVDGVIGMEGNGPIQGSPRNCGVIVAGADMAAVDATCCRIMGIDPAKIEYLNLAAGASGLNEALIPQRGEPIASVRTPFALLPQFDSLRLREKGDA